MVIALLGMGADVSVGCRSLQRCNDAFTSGGIQTRAQAIAKQFGREIGKFAPLSLDLNSFASIQSFASQLTDLNILIDNAAMAGLEPTNTEDGLGPIMGVNHFGVYLLTRLLLPQLTAGAERLGLASRIVVVASDAHKYSDPFDFANIDRKGLSSAIEGFTVYSQSKLANIFFARELASRLKSRGLPISVNSLHPGFIATDLARETKGIIRFFFDLFSQMAAMNSWDGAQNSIHLATSPELASVSGEYFVHFKAAHPHLGPYPDLIQQQLWQISANITHLPIDF